MERFYRIFTWTFGIGLLGAIVMTIITPTMISILFTPPVSFGTNCEPAAAWSMSKLVTSQGAGVVIGMIVGAVFQIWLNRRKNRNAVAQPA